MILNPDFEQIFYSKISTSVYKLGLDSIEKMKWIPYYEHSDFEIFNYYDLMVSFLKFSNEIPKWRLFHWSKRQTIYYSPNWEYENKKKDPPIFPRIQYHVLIETEVRKLQKINENDNKELIAKNYTKNKQQINQQTKSNTFLHAVVVREITGNNLSSGLFL